MTVMRLSELLYVGVRRNTWDPSSVSQRSGFEYAGGHSSLSVPTYYLRKGKAMRRHTARKLEVIEMRVLRSCTFREEEKREEVVTSKLNYKWPSKNTPRLGVFGLEN
ncbi:hypothetical protein BCON_0105g00010 [Botryotinia convoluta]|uniref:Uncharacterized protein n=1 Tax=Botryotinia convoluta TaxID=54673 RepID=A0A4Z1HZI5_9HELO|nr:hypothetical protein BCON_0105g00010 [Botryotinia convoluta]